MPVRRVEARVVRAPERRAGRLPDEKAVQLQETLLRLSAMNLTRREMAARADCSLATIYRKLGPAFKKGGR